MSQSPRDAVRRLMSDHHAVPAPSRYRIVRRIGRGGMADVYEANDTELRRPVALKILRPDVSAFSLRRFLREARIAARLQHPNIVPVHDTGTLDLPDTGRVFFISMALIKGTTMGALLDEGKTDTPRLLAMLEEVAEAVAYAHGNGVIHRDLKPDNILVDEEGRPRLTDFGIAQPTDGGRTVKGVMGTPYYMSPEQVRGETEAVDVRSDVYALGVILYEILTGRVPFDGRSAKEVYHRILNTEAPAPSSIRPGVDRDLETICRRAMAKSPRDRYAGARAFADDLRLARQGRTIQGGPPDLIRKAIRRLRRPRVQVALLAVVGAALLVGLGIVGWQLKRERDATRGARLQATAFAALEAGLQAQAIGDAGTAEAAWKRMSEACDQWEIAEPGAAGPHHLRGKMRRARGEAGPALESQDRALRLDPASAPARYERAMLRLASATLDDIRSRNHVPVEDLREAVATPGALRPAEARCAQGFLLLAEGRIADAERRFREAIAAGDPLADGWQGLIQAAVAEGALEGAHRRTREALEAHRGSAALRERLAQLEKRTR